MATNGSLNPLQVTANPLFHGMTFPNETRTGGNTNTPGIFFFMS